LCQHVGRDAVGVVGGRGEGDGEVAGGDVEEDFDVGVGGLGEGGLGTGDDLEAEDEAAGVFFAFHAINQAADEVCLHLEQAGRDTATILVLIFLLLLLLLLLLLFLFLQGTCHLEQHLKSPLSYRLGHGGDMYVLEYSTGNHIRLLPGGPPMVLEQRTQG